jgi:aspartate carbamoyltransferase catalytic subunit
MSGFKNPTLLSAAELQESEIRFLLSVAENLRTFVENDTIPPLLKGFTIAQLFFENSTRTRLSFEQAIRKLGGQVMHFSTSGSSVAKGESLVDTALNLKALGANAFTLRHGASGASQFLFNQVKLPVINAGDGQNEHPTQALLDALTLEETLGPLNGKKVLILGDITHSRVARSNIQVLSKLGAQVSLCGPGSMVSPLYRNWKVRIFDRPEEVLPSMDAVILLRVQKERHGQSLIPSLSEYARFWGLNSDRLKLLKPDAAILHPGPVNRGVELTTAVLKDSRSQIERQVENGVLVRMAVLAAACRLELLENWLQKEGFYV